MTSAVDNSKETVTIRAKHRDEEGRVKVEVETRNTDTVKPCREEVGGHGGKFTSDPRVHRLERHSADPRASVKKPAPKKGHGGKFTWEGPEFEADNELNAEPALDKGDPNYVDDDDGETAVDEEAKEMVVGEVEVGKVVEGREGVARLDVDHKLGV